MQDDWEKSHRGLSQDEISLMLQGHLEESIELTKKLNKEWEEKQQKQQQEMK